jgi:hypothetical protein
MRSHSARQHQMIASVGEEVEERHTAAGESMRNYLLVVLAVVVGGPTCISFNVPMMPVDMATLT